MRWTLIGINFRAHTPGSRRRCPHQRRTCWSCRRTVTSMRAWPPTRPVDDRPAAARRSRRVSSGSGEHLVVAQVKRDRRLWCIGVPGNEDRHFNIAFRTSRNTARARRTIHVCRRGTSRLAPKAALSAAAAATACTPRAVRRRAEAVLLALRRLPLPSVVGNVGKDLPCIALVRRLPSTSVSRRGPDNVRVIPTECASSSTRMTASSDVTSTPNSAASSMMLSMVIVDAEPSFDGADGRSYAWQCGRNAKRVCASRDRAAATSAGSSRASDARRDRVRGSVRRCLEEIGQHAWRFPEDHMHLFLVSHPKVINESTICRWHPSRGDTQLLHDLRSRCGPRRSIDPPRFLPPYSVAHEGWASDLRGARQAARLSTDAGEDGRQRRPSRHVVVMRWASSASSTTFRRLDGPADARPSHLGGMVPARVQAADAGALRPDDRIDDLAEQRAHNRSGDRTWSDRAALCRPTLGHPVVVTSRNRGGTLQLLGLAATRVAPSSSIATADTRK